MSSTGALAHVLSACIGVHLPASALDSFLLAPSHAAPACKVARSLPLQPEPIAPRDAGRDGGSDPPRRSSAATPHVQRSGLAGASKLPASAMRTAARSPCTNSVRHNDGGKRPPHKAPALGAGWSNAGRPVAWRQEPMHQNRTARWAAEQLAGRITTAGGAAQKRQAGQARQWNHRCTPMHTDGPESGMRVQSRTQPAAPGEQGRRVGPAPSVCICVHLWFHISCCLAACRPLPKGLSDRAAQPRPHAPAQLPDRRRPPPHPACNETMARLARDRPGRYFD